METQNVLQKFTLLRSDAGQEPPDRPLVTGSRTAHRPLPLHDSRDDLGKTETVHVEETFQCLKLPPHPIHSPRAMREPQNMIGRRPGEACGHEKPLVGRLSVATLTRDTSQSR